MIKVLFVCTGNICRSSTAEAVFRQKIEQAGLLDKFFIDSAGTHGWHVGGLSDERSIYTASKHGYSMENIISRQITDTDYTEFDYIFGMDSGHTLALEENKPENTTAQIELFLNFAGNTDEKEVKDPYYGGQKGFEETLRLIEEGTDAAIKKLSAVHAF